MVAGLDESVLRVGRELWIERDWTFRPSTRAGVVVAGVGRPGRPTGLDELAEGLATASRLVRRGGKVVLLSRAEGPLGPAWQRLTAAEPGAGLQALRGLEGEADYLAARQLARAVAWADVYLLSSLPDDQVEDLAMIPLSRPEEARRLVESADSCLFVSHADLTRARVADEEG